MLHRLCGPPSIPLSFTLASILPRRETSRVSFDPPVWHPCGAKTQRPSFHRLRLRLLGYLIPFAPLAFVPQCQSRPSRVLSPWVFFPSSTHFTATPGIPSTPTVLQPPSFPCRSSVKRWDLTRDLGGHLRTLYAQSFRITLASSVLPRLLAQS